jgi:HAD superfamily hydrolase (TIGR01549 family)
MLRAVFLDFYGTLVRFDPPAELIQVQACEAEGLTASAGAVARAYPTADAYMARENARGLIWRRSRPDQETFFAEYEHRLLAAAGLQVSSAVAARVWSRVSRANKDLALYEDASPALDEIRAAGLMTGIISNIGRDLQSLVIDLGLRDRMDVWVGIADAGEGKPHAPIFQAAMAKVGVGPREALHVGDQYDSDVVGSTGAGMHALLLDRTDSATPPMGCAVVRSLRDVLTYINSSNLL